MGEVRVGWYRAGAQKANSWQNGGGLDKMLSTDAPGGRPRLPAGLH